MFLNEIASWAESLDRPKQTQVGTRVVVRL
jgi:hypothetical protein